MFTLDQNKAKMRQSIKRKAKPKLQPNEYLIRLLLKEPRSRSKEDLKVLQGFLFDYLRDVLFGRAGHGSEERHPGAGLTENSMNSIVLDLLKTTVKLVAVPVDQRLAEYDKPLENAYIVLKGQGLVRIPYDGVQRTMTVRKYLNYLYQLPANTVDPVHVMIKTKNPNIVIDYNENANFMVRLRELRQTL